MSTILKTTKMSKSQASYAKKKTYLVILLLKQNSSKAYIEPKVEGKLQGLLLVATTRLLPW